jgi:hypothetical protein
MVFEKSKSVLPDEFIRQIAMMQCEIEALLVRVMVNMVDAIGIE